MQRFLQSLVLLTLVATSNLFAQPTRGFDDGPTNLMVVLRESPGTNKQDEALVSYGKLKANLPDGREVVVENAWFAYLGDMHVRFVFDSPTSMRGASQQDLDRLGLTPETALELAVSNIKRVYGAPRASPWNGLMQVKGKSPDLDSSYFLDKEFWNALFKQHPDGIVALVAKRGGLLFAPLSDAKAVDEMRRSVTYLYSSSERLRISSGLYLFKDGKWSVFQAPATQRER